MARTFEATVTFVSTDEEPYAACDAPSLYLPRQLCRSLDLSVGDFVSGSMERGLFGTRSWRATTLRRGAGQPASRARACLASEYALGEDDEDLQTAIARSLEDSHGDGASPPPLRQDQDGERRRQAQRDALKARERRERERQQQECERERAAHQRTLEEFEREERRWRGLKAGARPAGELPAEAELARQRQLEVLRRVAAEEEARKDAIAVEAAERAAAAAQAAAVERALAEAATPPAEPRRLAALADAPPAGGAGGPTGRGGRGGSRSPPGPRGRGGRGRAGRGGRGAAAAGVPFFPFPGVA